MYEVRARMARTNDTRINSFEAERAYASSAGGPRGCGMERDADSGAMNAEILTTSKSARLIDSESSFQAMPLGNASDWQIEQESES